MDKTKVKVLIRTRPTVNFASNNIKIDEVSGKIGIFIPKSEEQGYVNHQQENWAFQFDKVLQNASQEVVFGICAKDIVSSLLEGYSGTIMCYGQTGAGKTFTMSGSAQDYKYRGIIPRCISLVFQEIQSRYDQQILVRVSYLEIYNELMTDLLASALQPEVSQNLAIQEDIRGGVSVKGLIQKLCANEEECLSMLFEGETNRTIKEHTLNKQSSRSHCIFTIHLEMRSRVESSEKIIISKLNLVDLAGSERTKKTGSAGQNLIEAQFINKSLSFLEQVVVALSEKNRDHIPYRQSKLTNLLKDSVGGNSKTMVIANIWPEIYHLEETISTLKFASRMMKVQNETSVNVHLDPQVLLKKYEKEIKELKQELAMHDTLANRGRINYDPYPPEQQYQQQVIARQFLQGEIEDIEIESLRQVKELFFQMRNIYKALAKDIRDYGVDNLGQQQDAVRNEQISKKATLAGKQVEAVGDEENKYGFGVGKAPRDAKPMGQQLESLVVIPKDENPELEQKEDKDITQSFVADQGSPEKKIVNVDKNSVYIDFKEKEGKEYNDAIINNHNDLKESKIEIKQLTQLANEIKEQIEKLKIDLQKKQENKNQEEIQQGIIDEEEFEIIKQMKNHKKDYKQYFDRIKNLKASVLIIEQNIQQSKHLLLSEFEKWFKRKYGISVYDLDNPNINVKSEDQSEKNDLEDFDADALTYVNAKKKVTALKKARKQERFKIQQQN